MNEVGDLQALYRETVLEHSREPHNFSRLESANHRAVGHNPLCGDKITVYLNVHDGSVESLTFEGTGCAISIASASIMTDALKNESVASAQEKIDAVLNFLGAESAEAGPEAGDMAALGGVRAFPSRIKCATLAWKTLESALHNNPKTATTEN